MDQKASYFVHVIKFAVLSHFGDERAAIDDIFAIKDKEPPPKSME